MEVERDTGKTTERADSATREKVVKAAVDYLVSKGSAFEAALLLQAELDYAATWWDIGFPISGEGEVTFMDYTVTLRVPPERLEFYRQGLTEERKGQLSTALKEAIGSLLNASEHIQNVNITVEMALPDVYPGWREAALSQLHGDKQPLNQGVVGSTTTAAAWNGLRFRSRSEAVMSAALARANVLFFPLPAAVFNLEKKEPDFLVCAGGKWGILEVIGEPFHPSASKESERARWFKKRGVKVVESFDAARCYQEPDKVVQEFLSILRAG